MTEEVAPKAAIPSPEDTLRAQLKGAPRWLATMLLTLLSLSSWFTLPINAIARLAELETAIHFWNDFRARLPSLSVIFDGAQDLLKPIVEFWRELVAPIRSYLALVSPHISPLVIDAVVILTLLTPVGLRFLLAHRDIVQQGDRFAKAASELVAAAEAYLQFEESINRRPPDEICNQMVELDKPANALAFAVAWLTWRSQKKLNFNPRIMRVTRAAEYLRELDRRVQADRRAMLSARALFIFACFLAAILIFFFTLEHFSN